MLIVLASSVGCHHFTLNASQLTVCNILWMLVGSIGLPCFKLRSLPAYSERAETVNQKYDDL